jgi:two-component system, NarL family, sensor histidine kinase DevS
MGQLDGRTHHERLLEAALHLTSEHATPVVLQRIVEMAAEFTSARYAAMGVIDHEGWTTQFLTTGLSPDELARMGPLPRGHGVLGALIRNAAPLRLRDLSGDPRSVGLPPNHPPMSTFLGAPVKARGEVFGTIYVTEKQGNSEFTAVDEDTLVLLAAQAGAAIESARLSEANGQRQRRLEMSRQISTAILESSDANEVLRLVAAHTRELVAADIVTMSTFAGDGESLVIVAAGGEGSDSLPGSKLPISGSLSGEIARSGKPLILDDAGGDPGLHPTAGQGGPVGPGMLVPLAAGGRVFGTLGVARHVGGRPFTPEDMGLVESLAAQAAVALEYGRTQEQLRSLAVLEDRERIARDLHDGAIQSLFAVGMSLQATAALTEAAEVAGRIGTAVRELDRVILDLRSYIFGLRLELSGRQLEDALRRLAAEFEERSGVLTIVEIDGDIAAGLQGNAGEIVQLTREALANIARHAQATTCRVSLVRHEGMTVLEVDDDGVGFDPGAPSEGMGLLHFRERAALLGAELELRSGAESGTCVRVLFPST